MRLEDIIRRNLTHSSDPERDELDILSSHSSDLHKIIQSITLDSVYAALQYFQVTPRVIGAEYPLPLSIAVIKGEDVYTYWPADVYFEINGGKTIIEVETGRASTSEEKFRVGRKLEKRERTGSDYINFVFARPNEPVFTLKEYNKESCKAPFTYTFGSHTFREYCAPQDQFLESLLKKVFEIIAKRSREISPYNIL